MNRSELQSMSRERIADAEILAQGGRWSFAYYVAGYAVECALKSCVLSRMIHTGGVFSDKKFSERCFTHDFGKLIDLSGLVDELRAKSTANPPFTTNWEIVNDWRETSRYEPHDEAEARKLFDAINSPQDGVLSWITTFW